jgi:hypothetical protein
MLDADKLRQELTELRGRIKPQAQWTGADHIEQRSIVQRIRHLQNYLNNAEREGG